MWLQSGKIKKKKTWIRTEENVIGVIGYLKMSLAKDKWSILRKGRKKRICNK